MAPRACLRHRQHRRGTRHAPGDVDHGHDDGRRGRRRMAHQLHGTAGRRPAHEQPCGGHRAQRLRLRGGAPAGPRPALRFRHLEDRGAGRLCQRRVPADGGGADALRFGRAAVPTRDHPLPAGPAGRWPGPGREPGVGLDPGGRAACLPRARPWTQPCPRPGPEPAIGLSARRRRRGDVGGGHRRAGPAAGGSAGRGSTR